MAKRGQFPVEFDVHAGDLRDLEAGEILGVVAAAVNRRDFTALDKYVHPDYAQHNPAIPGERDGLRGFWASLPDTVRYELGAIIAEGDLVMAHGRYTAGPTSRCWPRTSSSSATARWSRTGTWGREEVPAEQTTAGLPMSPRRGPA